MTGSLWSALTAARQFDASARLPFSIGRVVVGSLARVHLPALRAWPGELAVSDLGVSLTSSDRDAALARINARLRSQGLIHAWRDELFDIADPKRPTGAALARTERAAARFWGTLTLGAHGNGYVADSHGRPTHLWIARRSLRKATDPGLHDNLVGGGVSAGQTVVQTLQREAFEEAGLTDPLVSACQRVIRLQRDVAQGLQFEDLHVFDIRLPAGWQPHNQDGEVHSFACLPVAAAITLAAGATMTVDAALVTLDFALRHTLLPAEQAAALQPRLQALVAMPKD